MKSIKVSSNAEGIDVLMSLDDEYFDLTLIEAKALCLQLSMAISSVEQLDQLCEDHDSQLED